MYTCPNVRAFVTLQHRDNQSTNDTFPSPELYQKKERPLKNSCWRKKCIGHSFACTFAGAIDTSQKERPLKNLCWRKKSRRVINRAPCRGEQRQPMITIENIVYNRWNSVTHCLKRWHIVIIIVFTTGLGFKRWRFVITTAFIGIGGKRWHIVIGISPGTVNGKFLLPLI